jgi:L-fuculose-phosphate aldolase
VIGSVSDRQGIIDACRKMVALGLVTGTSGNVSVRCEGGFLITPSAVPYEDMVPEAICFVPLAGAPEAGGPKPSTEWRFHQAVMRARADVAAIVHAHPPHATALACQRRRIPAVHYMVAAFGGADVPVTGYALFGSEALAAMVAEALAARDGCLMANHGAITVGGSLAQALWRMGELEGLAEVYRYAEQGGGAPVLLSEAEVAEALAAFRGYGIKT